VLADAIRSTNITNNASVGPGISFKPNGQNDKVRGAAFQNRGGKLVTLAPPGAANGKPEWPMPSYLSRARGVIGAVEVYLNVANWGGVPSGLVCGLMTLGGPLFFAARQRHSERQQLNGRN
jgi:hypothetical protein